MARKATVRAVLMFVVVIVSAEFAAGLFFAIQTGQVFWFRDVPLSEAIVPADPPTDSQLSKPLKAMLSPFFGVVMKPGTSYGAIADSKAMWAQKGYPMGPSDSGPYYKDWGANNFGFIEGQDYPVDAGANDFIVGVFGGSAANYLALDGREMISSKLHAIPSLADKRIVILNFAGHAVKQPQQSLMLSYFAAIGQHFDLIINMDGFNEAYVGYDNLINQQVDPSMPLVRWIYGIQNFFVDETSLDKMTATRAEQARLEDRLRTTNVALLYYISYFQRARLLVRAVDLDDNVERRIPGREYVVLLPAKSGLTFAAAIPSLARTWLVGSVQMDAVAHQIGAAYLHVLQPNPYFGARPFIEVNDGLFEKTDWPYPEIMPPVYQAFLKAGEALRAKGVAFVDATAAFDQHPEPIYYDTVAHLNLAGMRILVDDVLGPTLKNLVGLEKQSNPAMLPLRGKSVGVEARPSQSGTEAQ
jgi:hypothetical protein